MCLALMRHTLYPEIATGKRSYESYEIFHFQKSYEH